MCIFYIIHSVTKKEEDEKDGTKNARTFILGAIVYIILYMLVMNFAIKNEEMGGTLKAGLILLLVADIATMAYLYKNYYGRTILNEIVNEDQTEWKFNEQLHKYEKKTYADQNFEQQIDKIKNDYNAVKLDELKKKLEEMKEGEILQPLPDLDGNAVPEIEI